MSQHFPSGCQSIGVSASASVLPMNTQDWSPLGWTGWVLQSKGLSRVFCNTTVQKHQFFGTQLSSPPNSHIHTWWLEKMDFVGNVSAFYFLFNFLVCMKSFILFFYVSFFLISWRLITLQYCSEFCHTLKWISHGFTCVPHPDPPSHLPLHPILVGLPSAPGPSACLMHSTWAGDLFHPR